MSAAPFFREVAGGPDEVEVRWRSFQLDPSAPQHGGELTTPMLARKYGREFREYRGASMTVSGASDQGDKGILVNTVVNLPGRQPFAVDWQVSDRSGATKLINLIIEGVSMLTTERSEVRAIYEANRSNLDATIQSLRGRG